MGWKSLIVSILACALTALHTAEAQCRLPYLENVQQASTCQTRDVMETGHVGSVTWSLDPADPAPWWVLLSFTQLHLVDRVHVQTDDTSLMASFTLTFSDATTTELTLSGGSRRVELVDPVLTHSVAVNTDSTRLGTDRPSVLHFTFYYTGSKQTGVKLVSNAVCSSVNTPCPKLLDGDLDTWHIVRTNQKLEFNLASSVEIKGIAFLEANIDGASAYQNVDITIGQEKTQYVMCELPAEVGMSWQHIIFPGPRTASSVSVTFPDPLYGQGAVWGLYEVRVYTTDTGSDAAPVSTLCTDRSSLAGRSAVPVSDATTSAAVTTNGGVGKPTTTSKAQTTTINSNGRGKQPPIEGGSGQTPDTAPTILLIIIAILAAF